MKNSNTDCYTWYTYGNTKGITKLNLATVIIECKDVIIANFYKIVKLEVHYEEKILYNIFMNNRMCVSYEI